MSSVNVPVKKETHDTMKEHIKPIGVKVGYFVDKAIQEKIERDSKKKK